MNRLIILCLVLVLAGCVTAESRGNATYRILCPVILEGGVVATYVDSAGVIRPVMSEFTVGSGRSASGGAKIDIPGCIKIDIPKLEQGEDRSGGIIGLGMSIIRAVTLGG